MKRKRDTITVVVLDDGETFALIQGCEVRVYASTKRTNEEMDNGRLPDVKPKRVYTVSTLLAMHNAMQEALRNA